MDNKYIKAYSTYTNKKDFIEKAVASVKKTGAPVEAKPEVEEITSFVITAEDLNNLFSGFKGTLDYLYTLTGKTIEAINNEAEIIRNRHKDLSNKLEYLKTWANKIINKSLTSDSTYLFIDDNIYTLDIYKSVPVFQSYLLESGVRTETVESVYKKEVSSPAYAIDKDPTTFWSEQIISQSKIMTSMEEFTSRGVLLKYIMQFQRATILNKIIIYPMSWYPMSLIDVKFYYNNEEIRFYNNKSNISESMMEDREYIYYIPTVMCDKIEFVFEQEHPIIESKIKVLREIKEIADNLNMSIETADDYKTVAGLVYQLVEQVRNVNPSAVNELLISFGLLADTSLPETYSYNNYIYDFGARSIEAYYDTYYPTSTIKTNRYKLVSNLESISLETTDTTSNGDIISYYLNIGNNLRFPILPEGTQSYKERLIFEDDYAITTFPVTSSNYAVYENEGKTPVTITSTSLSDNRLKIAIIDNNIDEDAVYSITYEPDLSYTSIDLTGYVSNSFEKTEEYLISNDGKVELSVVPYINFDIINDTARFFRADDYDAVYYYTGSDIYYRDGVYYGQYYRGLASLTEYTQTTAIFDLSESISTSEVNNRFLCISDSYWKICSSTTSSLSVIGDNIGSTLTTGVQYNYVVSPYSTGPVLYYEPITVKVNGIKFKNITNYEKHENFVFNEEGQFYQEGSLLIFSSGQGNLSTIIYDSIIEYVEVEAFMSQKAYNNTNETPIISKIAVKVKQKA